MKVLYFDCFSGISGDMSVGSLLDLGVGEKEFRAELSKLNIEGYDLNIEKKLKNGIMGTSFDVILHELQHHHHNNGDVNEQHNGHHHENQAHHHHRNLDDIEKIIDNSLLNDNVKNMSKKIFNVVAEAEGKIHGKPPKEVHFHEVGALDSIVDIVGIAICIDQLNPNKIVFSYLPLTRGFVNCQHGVFPLPAPATFEILKDLPVYFSDAPIELVTPTGAAIAKALGDEFGDLKNMHIEKVGYGLGKADYDVPNVLRTIMFNIKQKDYNTVILLETNTDDMTGEALGYAMEKLFKAGALDVFFTPITMKKNRPGIVLSTLCNIEDKHKLIDIIFRETSTFGIKERIINRYTLERKIIKVQVFDRTIRCKAGIYKGEIVKLLPEYDDCKTVAINTNLPIEKIYEEAKLAAKSSKIKFFDK